MTLHDTHVLCEALEQYRDHCPPEEYRIVERLLERFTDETVDKLTQDYEMRSLLRCLESA